MRRHAWVAVRLEGRYESLRLRLYTPAMTLVSEVTMSGGVAGWRQVALGPELWTDLPAGIYFYSLSVYREGKSSLVTAPGRIVRLP
jgi:hypothetical protein